MYWKFFIKNISKKTTTTKVLFIKSKQWILRILYFKDDTFSKTFHNMLKQNVMPLFFNIFINKDKTVANYFVNFGAPLCYF